jgi:hypothetical protein
MFRHVRFICLEFRIIALYMPLRQYCFSHASFQTRCTASLRMHSTAASLRQLQSVEPSFNFQRVADRTRARRFGVNTKAGCLG